MNAPPTTPQEDKSKMEQKMKAAFETMRDPDKFKAKFEAKRRGGDLLMAAMVCVMAPIILAFVLGVLTVLIASLVFGIQALVVGTQYYASERQCESTMGVWMVVYGSLTVGVAGLQCCCNGVPMEKDDPGAKLSRGKKHSEEGKRGGVIQLLINLINLATFCWLCYGMNLILENTNDVGVCKSSLYDVFHLMVYFMFFGTIAMVAAMCFLMCGLIPAFIIIALDDDDAIKPRAGPIGGGFIDFNNNNNNNNNSRSVSSAKDALRQHRDEDGGKSATPSVEIPVPAIAVTTTTLQTT